MSNLQNVCVYATDGQWLLLTILFWFAVAVLLVNIVLLIFWYIQDSLERRHFLGQRTTDVEEEIRDL